MRCGPKNLVEKSLRRSGASVTWLNEPFDGEYVEADGKQYDDRFGWFIFLDGRHVGTAVKMKRQIQQQM